MLEIILQAIMAITGIVAVWMTQQTTYPELVKFAPVVGIISQPLWLYFTYTAAQYGMFITSIAYTYVWYLGVQTHWFIIKGK